MRDSLRLSEALSGSLKPSKALSSSFDPVGTRTGGCMDILNLPHDMISAKIVDENRLLWGVPSHICCIRSIITYERIELESTGFTDLEANLICFKI